MTRPPPPPGRSHQAPRGLHRLPLGPSALPSSRSVGGTQATAHFSPDPVSLGSRRPHPALRPPLGKPPSTQPAPLPPDQLTGGPPGPRRGLASPHHSLPAGQSPGPKARATASTIVTPESPPSASGSNPRPAYPAGSLTSPHGCPTDTRRERSRADRSRERRQPGPTGASRSFVERGREKRGRGWRGQGSREVCSFKTG